MKTFSRRRKSSQADELTNGTSKQNAGLTLETGKEDFKYIKGSDGAEVLELVPSLDRGDGKCERGEFIPKKWTGTKRKPSGALNLVQGKAARVESSPANTDVLELPNATPLKDDELPAATPPRSEPDSMDGQAPKLRPRERQLIFKPPMQEQTPSAQPLQPSCQGGTCSLQAVQGSSSSIPPSCSPTATGRSLFRRRIVRGGGEPAPSSAVPPAVTPNAARATSPSACLMAVVGGASERAASGGGYGCRLESARGTDALDISVVDIGSTRSKFTVERSAADPWARGAGLGVQGVEPEGQSEIEMEVVSAAGLQPLLPRTVRRADGVISTKKAAFLQPAAVAPRLSQQQPETATGEKEAIQQQEQLKKQESRLSGRQDHELPPSQQELLQHLEEQKHQREEPETHPKLPVRRHKLPHAGPPVQQQRQQQERPRHFGGLQEHLGPTSLKGESQQRLAAATAAIAASTCAAAASAPFPHSGKEPIPRSHPPRLSRPTLIPTIPTACQAISAKAATPPKATVATAAIPGTIALTTATNTAPPAGAGSGRAGRPIGRGRLPTGKPPAGASQGPLSAVTAGGPKRAGASQGAATTLTPQKSVPTTPLVLGGTRGASGIPGAVRITAAGVRQAASLLGAGNSAGPGFGGATSQGGSGGGRMGSQGDSDVAVHSILEAQERGELLQIQDDAQYALDGLASAEKAMATSGPTGCGAVVREAVVALAAILATRRGRAALSQPVNLAMKALTSLARLSVVPRDAVAALAAAVILLSLVQDDAMPAYGASYAAALLLRQVLVQVEQDQPPELQYWSQETTASASAPALLTVAATAPRAPRCPAGGVSAWALLRSARNVASAGGGNSCGGGGGVGSNTAVAAAVGRDGGGSGIAGGGDGGDGDKSMVLRLLRLIQEGPLARHVGRADLVEGPLPLALLAMVMASEASPSKINYVERFKDNLSKAGILPLLGRLVTARRDAVVRYVNDRRDAAAAVVTNTCEATRVPGAVDCTRGEDAATAPAPSGPTSSVRDTDTGGVGSGVTRQSPERWRLCDAGCRTAAIPRMPKDPYAFERSQPTGISQSQSPLVIASPSSPQLLPAATGAAAGAVVEVPALLPLWCLWELQLLLRVLENATFTHARNENGLLALRVCTSMPLDYAAASTAAAAAAATAGTGAAAGGLPPQLLSSQSDRATRFGSPHPQMGSQPLTGSQSSQQILELLEIQKQAGAGDEDMVEADEGAPFAAVLVDVVRQLTGLIDDSDYSDNGNNTGGPTGTGIGRGGVAAPPAVPVPPSAAAVCQVAAAVLMNLTHEHPDGVKVVAAAGGLQAFGDLVWRCCRPQHISTPAAGESQHQAGPPLATRCTSHQRLQLQVCLDSIVSSIDVLSVALGLLINMTSQSAANQRALREVVLMAAAPQLPLPVGAAQAQSCPALAPQLHPVPNPQAAPILQHGRMQQEDQRGKPTADGNMPPPRMVPLLCAVLNAMSHKPGGMGEAAASHGPPSMEDGDGGANAFHFNGNDDLGRGNGGTKTDEQGFAGVAGSGSGGNLGPQRSRPMGEEVTEATLEADLQGGHASIAQVYSAILLGNLLAGREADGDIGASGSGDGSSGGAVVQGDTAPEGSSAAAARAEARHLLFGGSLRPVTRGISRCLAFYCRADAITAESKDTLKALLERVQRFEALENVAARMAASAAAFGTDPDVYSTDGSLMSE
ncbi:hypothetical protein Vretimale_1767 [Volvox reticuliferus]|uniref:Wings apart-like protein C-terminal domain-containing protein n=1 Tax=Volvox reticuliferus TaxID=1737510 RepID=A0A8J4G3M0_9CHLO|nr:hypothetical protein Vretifemale_15381 [Volvox reticuliferus]GIL95825.1 hypothetical protein Vretimale_1767 [Volvox reticuliferus]